MDQNSGLAPSRVTKASWLALLVAGTGMGFDAYVINLPVILLPEIAKTFNSPVAVIAAIQSLFMAGYFFGTIGFNVIADYLGRRLALELSIVGYSIITVLGGFAPTLGWFSAARTATGVLAGGEQGVGAIYACEAWPDKWRGFGSANMFSFYPLGVIISIGAALLIVPHFGWRSTFAITLIMGAGIYLMRVLIFESSRFEKVAEQRKTEKRPLMLKQFWANKSLRRSTISLLLINLGDNFTYHGMSVLGLIWLRSSFHMSDFAFFMALLALYGVQFVECVLGAYLIDKIGRRPVGIFCALSVGIGVPLLGMVTNFYIALIVMAFTWCVYLGPGWGTKMALNPEVFPTEARGTGMALTHGAGRIAAILAPAVESYFLVRYGAAHALYPFAVSAAVIVIGYLLAPELKGQPIPDLLEEKSPAMKRSSEQLLAMEGE